MKHPDPFNLNRFLGAQESYYTDALKEIKQGYKQSHWIWFIFPQMRGLGISVLLFFVTYLYECRKYKKTK